MIKRIETIKNLGVFKDYSWDSRLPEFAQYNLIYGWNASGKTTLSKLFDYLPKPREEIKEEYPLLKYQIKCSEPDQIISQGEPWDKTIKVFNKNYVEKNVAVEKCRAKSIIILGEENEKINQQIKNDENSLSKQEQELAQKKKKHDYHEKEKGKLFTNIAKTIGEAIGGNALRGYRKNNAEDNFDELFKNSQDKEEYFLNEDEKNQCSSILRQEKKDRVYTIEPQYNVCRGEPSDDAAEIFEEHVKIAERLCLKVVDSVAIARLMEKEDIAKWVEEGLFLHRKHSSQSCEFCEQRLPLERLEDLDKFFNEADKELKDEIDKTLQSLGRIEDSVTGRSQSWPKKSELYEDLRTDYQTAREKVEEKGRESLESIKYLKERLEHKKYKTREAVHW